MSGAKPIPPRQRFLTRIDRAKDRIAVAERLMSAGRGHDAIRELESARALLLWVCTELSWILPAPDPATYHPRRPAAAPDAD